VENVEKKNVRKTVEILEPWRECLVDDDHAGNVGGAGRQFPSICVEGERTMTIGPRGFPLGAARIRRVPVIS
jgi:hypothetical protein